MEDGFDVVAIGIEQEGCIIAWVIGSLSGLAIVAASGGQPCLMEQSYSLAIPRLEGQMHMRRLAFILSQGVDPELVAGDVPVVIRQQRKFERPEYRAIEPGRGREIPGSQLDMIDQAASMQFHGKLPERPLPVMARGRLSDHCYPIMLTASVTSCASPSVIRRSEG